MQTGHDNQAHSLRRTAVWPVLASLLGLLLTHGVAIACLVYCVLIDPPQPMLMHHHQHRLAVPTAPDRATFVPAMPGSPVLEQGDQVPLALPVALLALVALGVVRWFRSLPTIRFASWIVPLPAPPPRLSTGH
jgi:hypothetical protein